MDDFHQTCPNSAKFGPYSRSSRALCALSYCVPFKSLPNRPPNQVARPLLAAGETISGKCPHFHLIAGLDSYPLPPNKNTFKQKREREPTRKHILMNAPAGRGRTKMRNKRKTWPSEGPPARGQQRATNALGPRVGDAICFRVRFSGKSALRPGETIRGPFGCLGRSALFVLLSPEICETFAPRVPDMSKHWGFCKHGVNKRPQKMSRGPRTWAFRSRFGDGRAKRPW